MPYSNLPIIAFLPCRRGSERVKHKNTRTFASIEGGLTKIKMEQLLNCPEIDSIIVSTDDPEVAETCQRLASNHTKSVNILERPAHLATSTASTDDVVKYIPEIISDGVILWTHVTSPFVDSNAYTNAIRAFREKSSDGYDSLMSVTRVQKFLWDENGPINYDREKEKWPRTQTLPVIYEVNSAIFLAPIEIYIQQQDRVGKKVVPFELSASQAMDIDWEEDFKLAQELWQHDK